MQIQVQFYSYFKELTGCPKTVMAVPAGATLGDLQDQLAVQFPKLGGMKKSTLLAVGVDYQTRDYVLQPDDVVALFPPVQGG